MLDQTLHDRYHLTALLGRGAMGEVYRATDRQTSREVAVKVLLSSLAVEPEMAARFRREGEMLSQLKHRHIVGFVDMFQHHGQYVLVMDYVPGGSLRDLLARGPLPVEQARRIALELCDALTSAHHLHIIHRDLKPGNILLTTDGAPLLGDFGVARLVGDELTTPGVVVGTQAYLPPEAWESHPLDAQADIWALGVTLFEMLAGRRPFEGPIVNRDPPDIRALRPDAPPGLAAIVAKMLRRDRAERYQSIREVALDLERLDEFFERTRTHTLVGSAVKSPRETGIADQDLGPVDCTIFAPPSVKPAERFFVQVFAHQPEQAEEAEKLAAEYDKDSQRRGFKSLETQIARATRLTFDLAMPGLEIDDPRQSLIWDGKPEAVKFGVRVPSDHQPGNIIGTVTISQNSVPIGHIKFKLEIIPASTQLSSRQSEPVGDDVRHYTMAFISYASKDRPKVLPRVQMLKPLGINYFQDILDLDPGDRWEKKLYLKIDECDLFLLFWSSAARKSEWVLKEVHYALARKGGDAFAPPEIRPIIIEGPPVPPPPKELAHLHFNDRLLYFMTDLTGGAANREGAVGKQLLNTLLDEFLDLLIRQYREFQIRLGRILRLGLVVMLVAGSMLGLWQWLGRPVLAEQLNNRGVAHYVAGELPEARAAFEQALWLDPDYAVAHYNLGQVYEDLVDEARARAEYQHALEGGLDAAYNNLGRLYILAGDYDSAVNLLLQGLDRTQDDAVRYGLLKNLGWARLRQGRSAEAEARLREAIALDPDPAAAHCLLAQVLDTPTLTDAALPEWEACLRAASSRNPDEDKWIEMARERLGKP